jgi:hypothetical protein
MMQYFSKSFSEAYIKSDLPFLPKRKILVYYNDGQFALVSIKMSKEKGKGAMITSGWHQVVNDTKMKKGDVFMFLFIGSHDCLRLMVSNFKYM